MTALVVVSGSFGSSGKQQAATAKKPPATIGKGGVLKGSELASTFTKVAQELHSQYVIGFAPAQLDNRVHKLAVRMKQPGMTARARRSYVAAADKMSTSGK